MKRFYFMIPGLLALGVLSGCAQPDPPGTNPPPVVKTQEAKKGQNVETISTAED